MMRIQIKMEVIQILMRRLIQLTRRKITQEIKLTQKILIQPNLILQSQMTRLQKTTQTKKF